jgi:hypothetical protein
VRSFELLLGNSRGHVDIVGSIDRDSPISLIFSKNPRLSYPKQKAPSDAVPSHWHWGSPQARLGW